MAPECFECAISTRNNRGDEAVTYMSHITEGSNHLLTEIAYMAHTAELPLYGISFGDILELHQENPGWQLQDGYYGIIGDLRRWTAYTVALRRTHGLQLFEQHFSPSCKSLYLSNLSHFISQYRQTRDLEPVLFCHTISVCIFAIKALHNRVPCVFQ